MKRLWFFDLDGTLADTDRDIREAWKATLADLGLDCPGFESGFVAGPPIEDMAKALFPDRYTDALGAAIRKGFGEHYDHDGFVNTVEYPGVLDRVRALKADGATVVVATNKRYVGARLMAQKFGWDDVFDGVYAGDMFKDDPAVGKMAKTALLAFLMRRYGAAPEECVIVGDTKSDFLAAKENGIESVGVTWGYGKPEELALADRLVSTAAEI
jgi:phosphoglycolate phosphatase